MRTDIFFRGCLFSHHDTVVFQPDPSFFGTITFVFDQETGEGSKIDARGDKPELEVSVTIQKVRSSRDPDHCSRGNLIVRVISEA